MKKAKKVLLFILVIRLKSMNIIEALSKNNITFLSFFVLGKFENYVPKSILENIRVLLERRQEGVRSKDLLYYYEVSEEIS